MKAKVTIVPRRGVLDPQGRAVLGALHSLGYAEVTEVRVGRFIELEVGLGAEPGGERAAAASGTVGAPGAASDGESVEQRLDAMCRRLLANTLIEDFRFEIEKAGK